MSPFLVSMVIAGIAVAIVVVLIVAIRVSYAIERVARPRPEGSLPRFTNIFASAFGSGISADDGPTLAKVRRLRVLLCVIAGLFAVMVVLTISISPPA